MTNQENLIKYLKTQFRAVELLMPKVLRQPSGKSVHQLRLATRRARVGLWVLGQNSSVLRFKHLGHELRTLGKTLGQVREVEVAIQDANHYGVQLLDLKSRRSNARRKIQNLVSGRHRNDLAKKFADAVNVISNFEGISFDIVKDKLMVKIDRQLKRNIHGKIKPHKLRIC